MLRLYEYALIGLALTVAVWAQDETTIRLNVKQVVVPTVVTDRSGHYVTGLRASDFDVFEDDAPQRIAAFGVDVANSPVAVVNAAGQTQSAPGKAAAGSPPPRTVIIVFDTIHTSTADLVRARQALEKLFAKESPTGAKYALIGVGTQIQVFQTATSDPAVILARLKSPAFTGALNHPAQLDFVAEMNGVKQTMENFCRTCACGRTAPNRQDTCNVQLQQIKRNIDAQGDRWAQVGEIFLSGLSRVTDELAKVEGARSLILVSDGFTLKPGREFYGLAAAYVPTRSYFREDPTGSLQPTLNKVLKTAAERNISAYTIDLRGVYLPSAQNGALDDVSGAQAGITRRSSGGGTLMADLDSSSSSISWENASVMSQLAKATGGTFYEGSNDLVKGFHDAVADGREYYTIAYNPTNSAADGKYRKISVLPKNRNLIIRAKAGYWADGPASP